MNWKDVDPESTNFSATVSGFNKIKKRSDKHLTDISQNMPNLILILTKQKSAKATLNDFKKP